MLFIKHFLNLKKKFIFFNLNNSLDVIKASFNNKSENFRNIIKNVIKPK